MWRCNMEILGKVITYSIMLVIFAGLGCVLGIVTCFFTDMFLKRFFAKSTKYNIMQAKCFGFVGFLWYSGMIVYGFVVGI